MKRAIVVLLLAACADDPVLTPSPTPEAPRPTCGDAGEANFACCLLVAGRIDDRHPVLPSCEEGGWTCHAGWATCPAPQAP